MKRNNSMNISTIAFALSNGKSRRFDSFLVSLIAYSQVENVKSIVENVFQ